MKRAFDSTAPAPEATGPLAAAGAARRAYKEAQAAVAVARARVEALEKRAEEIEAAADAALADAGVFTHHIYSNNTSNLYTLDKAEIERAWAAIVTAAGSEMGAFAAGFDLPQAEPLKMRDLPDVETRIDPSYLQRALRRARDFQVMGHSVVVNGTAMESEAAALFHTREAAEAAAADARRAVPRAVVRIGEARLSDVWGSQCEWFLDGDARSALELANLVCESMRKPRSLDSVFTLK